MRLDHITPKRSAIRAQGAVPSNPHTRIRLHQNICSTNYIFTTPLPFSPGGHSGVVPPDPFPNSVVKRACADDSVGPPHVKVGHRQAPIDPKPRSSFGAGFRLFRQTEIRSLIDRNLSLAGTHVAPPGFRIGRAAIQCAAIPGFPCLAESGSARSRARVRGHKKTGPGTGAGSSAGDLAPDQCGRFGRRMPTISCITRTTWQL